MRGKGDERRSHRRLNGAVRVVLSIGLLLVGRGVTTAAETHTAAPGQTLEEIAAEHGVSVEAVAEANGLDPTTEFVEEQELIIPEEGGAVEVYVVEPGDTIESIAAAHDTTVHALVDANGLGDPDDLDIGLELIIPAVDVTPASAASTGTIIDGVPAHRQQRSLSCEYAAVFIATSVFGNPIPEEDSTAATPLAANPHVGYRGDIDGEWGNTDDYGVYAEALAPHLESHGFAAEVSYGADPALLQAELDAGRPVIVWIGTRGDIGFYESDETGAYKLVPFMHVVVAYGYDEGGVYVSDPGSGGFDYLGWGGFLDMWAVLDGMAIAVYPV